MKTFIILFLVAAVFGAENYNGPEYAAFDASKLLPIEEMPGFWDNREKLPSVTGRMSSRIVGGSEVVPHSHPYQVALSMTFDRNVFVCGGSVLGLRSVLTAAHCIIGSSSTLVIAGAHNRNIIEPNQQRRTVLPDAYRIHEHYNPSNLNNDITILIVPTAFTFTSFVQPTRLPTAFASELFVGESARATGWGSTHNNGNLQSAVLRKTYNTVMTNAACEAVYGNSWVISSVICTLQQGSGICSGDSGGVLSVPRAGDERPIQIGITAFGMRNACSNFPGGFTRVTSFLSWISQHQV